MERSCLQTYVFACVLALAAFVGGTSSQPINNSTGNCTTNGDCDSVHICVDSECVDPCKGVCGVNTDCVLQERTPLCYCKQGYHGDPFTTCTPEPGECTKNSDCPSDKACLGNECVDPCQNGCGLNTECKVVNHRALCACLDGFVYVENKGCSPSSSPECQTNAHCPGDRACRLQKCVDPCDDGVCGNNTQCHVKDHYPVCACQVGYIGDAFNTCVPFSSGSSARPSKGGNKTYIFGPDQRNWYGALDYCYSRGMKLATVTNEDDWTKLTAVYRYSVVSGNTFWLGGHDLERYREFYWVTNGGRLTFTKWKEGEPSGEDYHCLAVNSYLEWVSHHCQNQKFYYACEEMR